MSKFEGIEFEVGDHVTNEEFRVKFDPGVYGKPDDYKVISYDYYRAAFKVSSNTGDIHVSSYTPNIPEELKKTAIERVKKYIEETPYDEYPEKTMKHFDRKNGEVKW